MSDDILRDRGFRRYAMNWLRDVAPMIRGSAYTIVISPGNKGVEDVKLAIEIGYSILMNKPIIVFVMPGREHMVPKLLRIADKIITGDPKDPADSDRMQAELKAYMDQ